jgi:tetratricopeptide (TPR) repeat protein
LSLRKVLSLQELGRRDEALSLAADLLNRPFPAGLEYRGIADFLVQHEHYDLALAAYQKALALDPTSADLHYNKATIQRFLGDIAAADQSCTAARRFLPGDPDALYLRSGLVSQTRDRNHVGELTTALQAAKHPRAVSKISYALAKEYEDLGEFSAAFAMMRRAGDARRRTMRYDVSLDENILLGIAAAYPAAAFAAGTPGYSGCSPVFIVGLPRTGTTLIESIISGTPELRSVGEVPNFSVELTNLVRQAMPDAPASPLAFVDNSTSIDFAELGRRYEQSVRHNTGVQGRFLDKLPLNFLYTGLIHRALPNAKIIHVRRDPMDTCIAIYKQHFEAFYPFSYDLHDLGRYYIAYHKLMAHWHRVLPGAILDVQYEALVDRPEAISREICSFCGIDWQPSRLNFAARRHAVTTASAVQVRQPLYTTSVGRWRLYESHLQELRHRLITGGIPQNEYDPPMP